MFKLRDVDSNPTGREDRVTNYLDLPEHRKSFYLPHGIFMQQWTILKENSQLTTVEVLIMKHYEETESP